MGDGRILAARTHLRAAMHTRRTWATRRVLDHVAAALVQLDAYAFEAVPPQAVRTKPPRSDQLDIVPDPTEIWPLKSEPPSPREGIAKPPLYADLEIVEKLPVQWGRLVVNKRVLTPGGVPGMVLHPPDEEHAWQCVVLYQRLGMTGTRRYRVGAFDPDSLTIVDGVGLDWEQEDDDD